MRSEIVVAVSSLATRRRSGLSGAPSSFGRRIRPLPTSSAALALAGPSRIVVAIRPQRQGALGRAVLVPCSTRGASHHSTPRDAIPRMQRPSAIRGVALMGVAHAVGIRRVDRFNRYMSGGPCPRSIREAHRAQSATRCLHRTSAPRRHETSSVALRLGCLETNGQEELKANGGKGEVEQEEGTSARPARF